MDTGDRVWANVICQMAEHNSIHKRGFEILRKDNLQPALDALRNKKQN